MPLSQSFLSVGGDLVVSAVKTPESGEKGLVLRVYNPSGAEAKASVNCLLPVADACFCDTLERKKEGEISLAGMTQAQAQRNLSTDLQVQNVKSCVIPKENGTEAPCYEFHCKSKTTQDEVLVYVNTQTGQEEDIKLLLYSDEGTLVK